MSIAAVALVCLILCTLTSAATGSGGSVLNVFETATAKSDVSDASTSYSVSTVSPVRSIDAFSRSAGGCECAAPFPLRRGGAMPQMDRLAAAIRVRYKSFCRGGGLGDVSDVNVVDAGIAQRSESGIAVPKRNRLPVMPSLRTPCPQ